MASEHLDCHCRPWRRRRHVPPPANGPRGAQPNGPHRHSRPREESPLRFDLETPPRIGAEPPPPFAQAAVA